MGKYIKIEFNILQTSLIKLIFITFLPIIFSCQKTKPDKKPVKPNVSVKEKEQKKEIVIWKGKKKTVIKVINGTFLGNEKRNWYGSNVPKSWDLIWKLNLGSGKTQLKKDKEVTWAGAGWTGQPLLILENNHPYLLQGAYDHNLKKIDAETGKIVWEYNFGDVIKGTGSIWLNENSDIPELRCLILQGSRQSKNFWNKVAPSLKALSWLSGEEVWELNIERTKSYSRDCDASAIILNDTAYIGLENGLFVGLDPDPRNAIPSQKILQPKILHQDTLYTQKDAINHAGNLVVEASPAKLGNHLYIAAGAGHVYGFNLNTKEIDWDFFIGSDIDGSPIVTSDSCLLISVEKQYINSQGGLLKLNPRKKPENAVVWYFPTQNKNFADWKGGIIGSASITDSYSETSKLHYAAFTAIDGFTYVIDYKSVTNDSVVLFNKKKTIKPELIFKYKTGPSIATPLLIEDYLIVAGYNGLHIFKRKNQEYVLLKKIEHTFEATPFIYDKKLYVASRDGFLYCFGEK